MKVLVEFFVDGNGHLHVKADLLQSHNLASFLVSCFIYDTVCALTYLFNLLEFFHFSIFTVVLDSKCRLDIVSTCAAPD